MFARILVGIDGSDHSIRAFSEAFKLSKIVNGLIRVIHVCPYNYTEVDGATEFYYQKIIRKDPNFIKAEKIIVAAGLKIEMLPTEVDVATTIVNKAHEDGFNLIVVGARGLSKIKELVLGSVSDGVIRKAPCSVLVVK